VTWKPLPTARSDRDPRPVIASLGRVADRLGLGSPAALGAVFSRWEQIVGPDIAAHARPVALRGGVLTIMVDQPTWAASLRLLAGDLLCRVAQESGEPVEELVVRVSGERPSRRR
jgi:predicted nucleic acid-binding Zn ribbon protein